MSLAITHFMYGASVGLAVMLWIRPTADPRLPITVGGLWAMVPDIAKFIPGVSWLHDSPILASLFGLHYLFDLGDPNDSIWLALFAVGLFTLMSLGSQLALILDGTKSKSN